MGTHEITADKRQAGFTLVELAVVMIIIGLLIGGVLKGQELIANAQITGTASAVKSIDAATTTFRDTYAALPGISPTRLPVCQTASGFVTILAMATRVLIPMPLMRG
ncbi:MAG: prepilin-type N-terminal cleavage/methylation domain-containing protein [Rhodospirillales bacterium]|nr:prepilin-type N-terminal cleavage/methylation domain-containing protein [Rhodospirillales bacterium]